MNEIEEHDVKVLLIVDPNLLAIQIANKRIGDVDDPDGHLVVLLDVVPQQRHDFLESLGGWVICGHGDRNLLGFSLEAGSRAVNGKSNPKRNNVILTYSVAPFGSFWRLEGTSMMGLSPKGPGNL
jgi:hypothetical protein